MEKEDMLWHLTRLEIQYWLDQKAQEFVVEENQNPRLTTEQWLGRYMYPDLHEYYFFELSIILYEWLVQLTSQKTNFQGVQPTC